MPPVDLSVTEITASNKISLALFDVDGTLHDKSGSAHPVVREAIEELKSQGCLVGLASGRASWNVRDICKEVGVNGPSILFGGCAVVQPDGTVSKVVVIENNEAHRFIDRCRELDANIELISLEATYCEKEGPLFEIHATYYPFKQRLVDDLHVVADSGPVPKFTLLLDFQQPGQRELLETLREEFPGFQLLIATGARNPDLGFVNVLPAAARPSERLKEIVAEFSIDPLRTASFGDGESDMDLLKSVGIGVAMGNALPQVKAVAKYVTTHVEEQGVALAIRKLFLRR